MFREENAALRRLTLAGSLGSRLEPQMQKPDHPINATNLAYVEQLYAQFVQDPSSVPEAWRAYFSGMDGEAETSDEVNPSHRSGPSSVVISIEVVLFQRQTRA